MSSIHQYLIITLSYWAFTITDGALRMLVVLYFHNLQYSALEIATLFLFYEFFGIITNLFGGWLGARIGLNKTMHMGMILQCFALLLLCVDPSILSIVYVMSAQAISGIAKDLNKMSAKSSLKFILSKNQESKLYKWVALLTGSKNSLKGIGFFIGSFLLSMVGFRWSLVCLIALLLLVFIPSKILLKQEFGLMKNKPKFKDLFSKSKSINLLSGARFFLFGARDIWFVIALPVYLQSNLQWSHTDVGIFMAIWVIFYGVIQAITPKLVRSASINVLNFWSILLLLIPGIIALLISYNINVGSIIMIGLIIFGGNFAINSSLHSYFILLFSDKESSSLDVGFYYMSNSCGRLIGTILSGLIYQSYGFSACLYLSSVFLFFAFLFTKKLDLSSKLENTSFC